MNMNGVFYIKNDCHEISQQCLPQTITPNIPISIEYPVTGKYETYDIDGGDFIARLYLSHREDFDGYMIYQVTLFSRSGETIAMCSRYESIETIETAIVGTCAGRYENRLVGFTTSLN